MTTVRIGINPITWTNDDVPELGGDTPLEVCLSETKLAGYAGSELGVSSRVKRKYFALLLRHTGWILFRAGMTDELQRTRWMKSSTLFYRT